jgi:FkbM family methyltransferase
VARRYPGLLALACEPDREACAVARAHAADRAGVEVFEETSQDFLARLVRERSALFDRPLLAWLDAHDHGFAWPLLEEVALLTSRCARGWLLIDDFKVPHDARFGFDAYGGAECSFAYVKPALAPGIAYRLYYPAYAEHTSPWHPLRGFGLIQFGPAGEALERLDRRLPDVCMHAAARGVEETQLAPALEAVAAAFAAGELEQAAELLRAELERDPESPRAWNDLGVCLAHQGDGRAALAALASALRLDPDHQGARANLRDVHRALHPPQAGRVLPVAPGAWGRMVRRDPFDDLAALLELPRPTLVDGGANRGTTVAALRARFPEALIHAFEPIPALAQGLRARFAADPRLIVHQAALASEEGFLAFQVLASDVASSALSASDLARRYQGEHVDVRERLEVLALRLDAAVPETIDALKLDLQGFELEALRGLGRRLGEVRAILTEVELAPLYDGQPLFADVDLFLRAQGFRLFHLYELWSHPDGQVTAADALYLNERFFRRA